MGSDRIGNQATPAAVSRGERVVIALAFLPLLVALAEWLFLDAALPPGWPGALSLLAPLLAGAGVFFRADRRGWMLPAWAVAFASLAVLWLAWPMPDGQSLRSPAPWLAAMAAAIGVGARIGGVAPAVGVVARSLGGFLVALAGLSLVAVIDDSPKGTLALGLGSILAYAALGTWLMARDLEPGPFRTLRFCTALLAGLALLVMTGWFLHVPYIVQGGTQYVPMQFNSAVCALLVAAALRLLAAGRRNLALLPLAPVVIFCTASLLEEYAGLVLGAGEWLVQHGIVAEGVVPGRMAPNTATAFLLASFGIVLAPAGGKGSPARWSATWACGFVISMIALIVLAGYLMQVPVLRGWGAYTPMALMTAIALLLIGVALGAGGSEYRRALSQRAGWVPLVVAAAAIGVSLMVWFAIDRDQATRREAVLQRQSDLVEQAMQSGIRDRSNELRRMALRMVDAADATDRAALFDLDAEIYLRDFPAFVTLIWTDQQARVLRQRSRPGEGVDVLGRSLDFDPIRERLFEQVRRDGEVGESPPVALLDGGTGELLVAPLSRGGELQGFLVAVVKYEELFARVLGNAAPDNALELRHGSDLLYARGTPPPGTEALVRPIEGAGATLELRLWPDAAESTALANVLLFTGLITGGLVALALRLAGLARERAEVAERRGRELADQVEAAQRASLALEEAEQELSSVFESISDAFYTLDRDWRFVFVNPRAEQMMQKPRAELVGNRVWEVFPEARGTVIEHKFREAVNEGVAVEFEVYFPPLDRWFIARCYPHPQGLAVYFQDISDRKLAEAAARQARAASERAQRMARLGSWEQDLASGELHLSKEAESIFGLGPGQAIRSFPELLKRVHFEDRNRLEQARHRLHAGQDADLEVEYRILHPDGETRQVRELGTLVRNAAGEPVAASGAIQDTTDQQHAENALRELSRRLEQSLVMNRLVLENSLDVICVLDANGRFTQVSTASESVWGYAPGELVGRAHFDLAHPDDRAHTLREGAAVLAGRPTVDFRNRVVRKDGRVVAMQWSAVWSARDRMMFAIARDVTEATRQSEALHQAKAALQLAQTVARMGAWEFDIIANQLYWSDEVYRLFQVAPEEFEGTFEAFAARVHPDDLDLLQQAQARTLAGKGDLDVEHRIVLPDGSLGYVHERAQLLRDDQGRPWKLAGSVQDITGRKRAQSLEDGKRRILAAIAARRPLGENLMALVRLAERQMPGAFGSVLLLDETGEHVRVGAAPNLPAEYNAAIHGLAIGPAAGSCGTAAFRGERVVVSDINNDPLWTDYVSLAQPHGLRACWSTPVKASDGRVVATFAIYYREVREPFESDLELIDGLAALCAVAIEHDAAFQSIATGQQRFRSLFDEHPDVVYSLDLAGRFTEVNEQFQRVAGLRPDGILGRPFDEHVLDTEREVVRAHFEAATHGEARSYEMTAVAEDGRRVEMRVTNLPIIVDGRVTGVFGIAQDISVLRKHQRELSDALDAAENLSQQLHRLSEASISVNRDLDEETLYQQLVERAREIIGAHQSLVSVAATDGGGQLLTAFSLSDKYARWREYDAPIDGSGIYSLVGETQLPMRMTQAELEAHPRWSNFGAESQRHPPMRGWLAVPMVGSDGQTLGILQLSDKYRGEFSEEDEQVALQFSQMAVIAIERARLLAKLQVRDRFFEMSLEVFVVYDPTTGRWVQVNQMLADITGYTREELCSRPIIDYIHPDDAAATRDRSRSLGQGEKVNLSFVNRYVCRDGSVRWMEWMSAPSTDGLVYAVGRDITQRLQAEATLRQTLADLNARNRELQDFAFIASHDLQEPLRKIRAFADRLQQRHAASLADEARDYLDRTSQAANRMQVLINDLLAYSRVAARGKPFTQVKLDGVMAGVLDDLEASLEASGGRVEAGPLPTIEADATQMRQLFQNLLSNALKFRSPDRAPVVHVSAEAESGVDGPGWILRFQDNGIGFEPRHAEKVFAPFQRLHARQEYDGTGIGLAIVRRIVERHRGTIHAEGRPGEGSTFVIRLPQRQPAGPAGLANPLSDP
ncbi:PAS domain S-box protein [Arenimonas sp.]|uniref:PAS domain S-box protein n=1 Tax=Arenimonas sp. TaxID=1872635 RepID=UPI0035ADC143